MKRISWSLLPTLLITPAGTVAAQDAKAVTAIGSWTFSTETDPISDRRMASITVRTGKSEFAFQCDADGPNSIYPIFVASQYLGGRGIGYDRRNITLRFDADQPIEATWVYKDRLAFIPHDHKQAVSLMTRAATAQKLAIRAITYDSQFVDAVFQLSDTASALAKLAEACGDKVNS